MADGKRDLTDAGFTMEEVETSAGGVTYTVPVAKGPSWQTFYDFWKSEGKNPDEVLTDVLNAAQEQGAKQGNKGDVRKAISAAEGDPSEDPKVLEAISAHQDKTRGFMIGAPRGGGGARHATGLTQKQRQDLGTKLAEVYQSKGAEGKAPTQADINSIYDELGIPRPGSDDDE